MVVDGMQRLSCNVQGSAAILTETLNLSPHHGKRFDDPLHGALLYGLVAGYRHIKILC